MAGGHSPSGHQPGGHEPVGHHPGGVAESGAVGTPITNSQATSDVPVNYEICSRTGFRQLPGTLVRDGYGELVRSASMDNRHPQDFVKSRQDRQRGSLRPEQVDVFIVTSIAPEDL